MTEKRYIKQSNQDLQLLKSSNLSQNFNLFWTLDETRTTSQESTEGSHPWVEYAQDSRSSLLHDSHESQNHNESQNYLIHHLWVRNQLNLGELCCRLHMNFNIILLNQAKMDKDIIIQRLNGACVRFLVCILILSAYCHIVMIDYICSVKIPSIM